MGNFEKVVGCHWERKADGSSISKRTKTAEEMINRFKLGDLSSVATPATAGEQISKDWCPNEGSKEHTMINKQKKGRQFYRTTGEMDVAGMSLFTCYRALVGSLLWIARCTRPDIMHIVSQLSRFMQNPGLKQLRCAKRVVQYLSATQRRGIVWHAKRSDGKKNQLSAFSDSSYANRENAKSTYGYLTCLNSGPVDYASKVQFDVAQSTCEAQYVALSKAIVSAIVMGELDTEMDPRQETIPVHCDNTAPIAISI